MEITKSNIKLIQSTIRLFKAVPVVNECFGKINFVGSEDTVERGYVFSQEVLDNYKDLYILIDLFSEEYGLTAEQLNASFHKSWEKIKNASDQQLFIEQIVHYITTYGFESLGIYDESSVYIPHEKLEIPGLEEDIKLVVIKGYTKEELKKKVIEFLSLGVALKEQTMNDLMTIINYVGFGTDEIEQIKNREIKIQLYDRLGVIPENPTEFLRYLIFKTTRETLLIKNDNLINLIKEKANQNSCDLLLEYEVLYGLDKLSEVFYRFKPLLIAYKKYNTHNRIINKIRKLAKKHHKPMKEDYLNSITAKLKKGEVVDYFELQEELDKVNTFRKISLAYALKYRTLDTKSIMYQVRNGRSWAKEFKFDESCKQDINLIFKEVLRSITRDMEKNVDGKKIYLPEHIHYTLPATEKQFIGNFPNGSYVKVPDNMIVGINWFNTKRRIDLDLSMSSIDGKIGWDADYRTEGREVMFSGDVTTAGGKNGATELFRFEKQPTNPYIMTVNYYNYDKEDPVDFKILVADEKPTKNFGGNYMVDPNNVLAVCKSTIKDNQMVLGLVIPSEDGNRFYFTETGLGNSISTRNDESLKHAREFLVNKYNNSIELKEVLERAGAIFVDNVEDADIDLSPEALEKDTILGLLR